MAWTFDNDLRKAALDGIIACFNSGHAKFTDSGDAELAKPTFNSTAFGAATDAAPSVATAGAFTADTSVTAGTIAKVLFTNAAENVNLATGTVDTESADFNVTDPVIPANAVSVNVTGLTFSLALT